MARVERPNLAPKSAILAECGKLRFCSPVARCVQHKRIKNFKLYSKTISKNGCGRIRNSPRLGAAPNITTGGQIGPALASKEGANRGRSLLCVLVHFWTRN